MFKFLRKYNKLILVVGGSLLMVVFLLPQAVQQFGPNPLNQVQFRAAGRAFDGRDIQRAGQELAVLQTVQQAAGVPFVPVQDVEHWILLTIEAERMGMVGGPEDAGRLFQMIAEDAAQRSRPQFNMGAMSEDARLQAYDETLAALRQGRDAAINQGATAPFVDRALARLRGVFRLNATLGGLSEISTQEAAYFGRELFDTAITDLGLILAEDRPLEGVEQPTEAELREQFDRYKDSTGADNDFGYGYRLDDAVKLELLEIDKASIRQAIELDPVEVNTHWRRNRDRFGDSFSSARSFVESDMRRTRLDEILRAVQESVRRELIKARLDVEREDTFLSLPEDWAERRPSFERLAEIAQAEIDEQVGAPTPATTVRRLAEEWLTREDVAGLSVGRATVTTAAGPLQFPAFVFSVRELAPASGVGLQAGVTYGPIDTAPRSVYTRVLEVREEGPPASLEIVADRVRRDLLTRARYDRLMERKDSIRATAVDAGRLAGLYDQFDEMIAQLGVRVTRESMRPAERATGTVRGDVPAVRDAIVDAAQSWSPLEPIEEIPVGERTLAIEVPSEHALAIAIIRARQPVTFERLRTQDARVMFEAGSEYGAGTTFALSDGALSFEALSRRLNYRDTTPPDEEADALLDEEEAAEGDQDGAGGERAAG